MDAILWLEDHGVQFWLISLLTLAIFSFLYRDNPVYKFAEHLYVGIAAGYYFYQAFRGTIYPNLVEHLWRGIGELNAGGGSAWSQARWGALVLGLLVLSRLIPKLAWVSRWPMALVVGAFAGLNLVGYAQTNLVDQVHGTLVPLAGTMPDGEGIPWLPPLGAVSGASVINHAILVGGVVFALIYFFFSAGRGRIMSELGRVGISVIMITFGATYGNIVLARISLLIGRLQQLQEANAAEHGYPTLTSAVIVVVFLLVWRLLVYRGEPAEGEEPPAPATK